MKLQGRVCVGFEVSVGLQEWMMELELDGAGGAADFGIFLTRVEDKAPGMNEIFMSEIMEGKELRIEWPMKRNGG